jgi:hypothetical protein
VELELLRVGIVINGGEVLVLVDDKTHFTPPRNMKPDLVPKAVGSKFANDEPAA